MGSLMKLLAGSILLSIPFLLWLAIYLKTQRKSGLLLTFCFGVCLMPMGAWLQHAVRNSLRFNEDWATLATKIGVFLSWAFIEEIARFLSVFLKTFQSDLLKTCRDGILFAVSATLGMVVSENLGYFFFVRTGILSNAAGYGEVVIGAFIRVIFPLAMHLACGVILGYCIGLAKMNKRQRVFWFAIGIFSSTAVHFLYNHGGAVFSDGFNFMTSGVLENLIFRFLALSIGIFFALKLINKARNQPC